MKQIRGIYAAGMSIFKDNLSLDVQKTIEHSEKLIQMGCHGVAIFGSTGQAQLISISEKIDLLNKLSTNEHKNKFLVGTGLNSLSDTINLMQISCSLGLNKFLVINLGTIKLKTIINTLILRFIKKLIMFHFKY